MPYRKSEWGTGEAGLAHRLGEQPRRATPPPRPPTSGSGCRGAGYRPSPGGLFLGCQAGEVCPTVWTAAYPVALVLRCFPTRGTLSGGGFTASSRLRRWMPHGGEACWGIRSDRPVTRSEVTVMIAKRVLVVGGLVAALAVPTGLAV